MKRSHRCWHRGIGAALLPVLLGLLLWSAWARHSAAPVAEQAPRTVPQAADGR